MQTWIINAVLSVTPAGNCAIIADETDIDSSWTDFKAINDQKHLRFPADRCHILVENDIVIQSYQRNIILRRLARS